MKRLIIFLLFTFTIVTAYAGQENPENTLHISLKGVKGNPLKNTGKMYATVKGDTAAYGFKHDGTVKLHSESPIDTVYIISGKALFTVSSAGMDSLVLYFNNPKSLKQYSQGDLDKKIDYGYGKVSVKDNTMPLTIVKVDNPEIYQDLATYLRGRVAGLHVDNENRVIIRGINSLTALDLEPLVVVDGAQMSFQSANMLVRPADIKSITVDKTGSMFGLRGANGVIIITTK